MTDTLVRLYKGFDGFIWIAIGRDCQVKTTYFIIYLDEFYADEIAGISVVSALNRTLEPHLLTMSP